MLVFCAQSYHFRLGSIIYVMLISAVEMVFPHSVCFRNIDSTNLISPAIDDVDVHTYSRSLVRSLVEERTL